MHSLLRILKMNKGGQQPIGFNISDKFYTFRVNPLTRKWLINTCSSIPS